VVCACTPARASAWQLVPFVRHLCPCACGQVPIHTRPALPETGLLQGRRDAGACATGCAPVIARPTGSQAVAISCSNRTTASGTAGPAEHRPTRGTSQRWIRKNPRRASFLTQPARDQQGVFGLRGSSGRGSPSQARQRSDVLHRPLDNAIVKEWYNAPSIATH
jgi:hypothetical protein